MIDVAELRAFLSAPRRSVGRPLYLELEPDAVFAMLHDPADAGRRTTGVLVCPAFGWDELCSHRSVRAFADLCARAGMPTLRLDLPGSGDSAGSPRDPGRLDAWLGAVSAGATVLRERERCDRVVAFGIGLGGMLASLALASGAPIDDLILWAVAPRGARMLRELRALARLVAAVDADDGVSVDQADGGMQVAGFALSAETVSKLEPIDLAALAIPEAQRRRALLLGRDGRPDASLVEAFTKRGVQVTVDDGIGFGGMMVDPVLSVVPPQALARILDWLDGAPPASATTAVPGPAVGVADRIELEVGDGAIRESPFEFEHRGLRLSGVLAEPLSAPAGGVCAVLLSVGSDRRIGPNRMWVDYSRPWAAQGMPTLRLDMLTVGDSDGEERPYEIGDYYQDTFRLQVLDALDALELRGYSSFVLCGLCSGAYWSLHAALSDRRVRVLLLLNAVAIYWSAGVGVIRDIRRARTLWRERRLGTLVKMLLTQRWRIARLARTLTRNLVRRGGDGATPLRFDAQIAGALDTLRDNGVDVTFFFGRDERLYEDLVAGRIVEQLARWPGIRVTPMLTRNHVLRTFDEQRNLAGLLDDEITRLTSVPEPERARR